MLYASASSMSGKLPYCICSFVDFVSFHRAWEPFHLDDLDVCVNLSLHLEIFLMLEKLFTIYLRTRLKGTKMGKTLPNKPLFTNPSIKDYVGFLYICISGYYLHK